MLDHAVKQANKTPFQYSKFSSRTDQLQISKERFIVRPRRRLCYTYFYFIAFSVFQYTWSILECPFLNSNRYDGIRFLPLITGFILNSGKVWILCVAVKCIDIFSEGGDLYYLISCPLNQNISQLVLVLNKWRSCINAFLGSSLKY